jgi:hypothetical protein
MVTSDIPMKDEDWKSPLCSVLLLFVNARPARKVGVAPVMYLQCLLLGSNQLD